MNFTKAFLLLALAFSFAAVAARADFDGEDEHHHGGYGHPGYFGPGFTPGPNPGYCPPGYNPGFLPPPPAPGYYPAPGYVFTCFSQNNFGQWFYATNFNPNFAQAQAMQFCAMTGGYCVPTGCR